MLGLGSTELAIASLLLGLAIGYFLGRREKRARQR